MQREPRWYSDTAADDLKLSVVTTAFCIVRRVQRLSHATALLPLFLFLYGPSLRYCRSISPALPPSILFSLLCLSLRGKPSSFVFLTIIIALHLWGVVTVGVLDRHESTGKEKQQPGKWRMLLYLQFWEGVEQAAQVKKLFLLSSSSLSPDIWPCLNSWS